MMSRIEQEKETVRQMVEIFCRGKNHRLEGLCPECSALLHYAYARLDRCPFGAHKPACKACRIHCYKPEMRQQMRDVMRYAGPRMLWHHPLAAIRHLVRTSTRRA